MSNAAQEPSKCRSTAELRNVNHSASEAEFKLRRTTSNTNSQHARRTDATQEMEESGAENHDCESNSNHPVLPFNDLMQTCTTMHMRQSNGTVVRLDDGAVSNFGRILKQPIDHIVC